MHVQKLGCSIFVLMEAIIFVRDFQGSAWPASRPVHLAITQVALPGSLGSQQEAQPTSTKSVKPKTKTPTHVQKLGSCSISILMESIFSFFVFLVLRCWPGQPVGQSAWPSTQPTDLASQLRQSARSAAHFLEIQRTRKPTTNNTCTETGKR